jgi:hypothetical protein
MTGRPARAWIACAIVLLSLVVFVRAVPDIAPESDFAVIDIHVLNVIRDLQPVGAYSRYQWSHPGPMYFQLLAPLYWLSGYRHLSIQIMAALLNVACIVGVIAIVARTAKSQGVIVACGVMVALFVLRGWGVVASPWTAHVPILPLALLIVSGAAVAAGSVRLLPVVVAAASFAAQAHVGVVLCALSIVAGTFVLLALNASAWPRVRRPLLISIALGAMLWILPLADAIRPSGGHNLQALITFFGSRPPVPRRLGDRAFAYYFAGPMATDLTLAWGEGPPRLATPAVLRVAQIQGVLLLVAAIVWALRRRRFEASIAALTLVGAAAAFLSVRRLPEDPVNHTVYWVSMLGAIGWVPILPWLLDPILRRVTHVAPGLARGATRWVPRLAAAGLVVCAIWQIGERYRAGAQTSRRNLELTRAVRARVEEAGTRQPNVHVTQDLWHVAAAVILQLARGDMRPTVDADWVSMFGRPYRPSGTEPVRVRFAYFQEHTTDLKYRSNYRLLASADQVYAYSMEPPPAAAVAAGVRIIDATPVLARLADRLLDRVFPTGEGRDASVVDFPTPISYVTVDLPAGAVGVRLWGQPDGTWQLRCTADGAEFHRMGRVTIQAGPGAGAGEAYITELSSCRQLKIAPADGMPSLWLSEVEVLR